MSSDQTRRRTALMFQAREQGMSWGDIGHKFRIDRSSAAKAVARYRGRLASSRRAPFYKGETVYDPSNVHLGDHRVEDCRRTLRADGEMYWLVTSIGLTNGGWYYCDAARLVLGPAPVEGGPRFPDVSVDLSDDKHLVSRTITALKTAGATEDEIAEYYVSALRGDYVQMVAETQRWVATTYTGEPSHGQGVV